MSQVPLPQCGVHAEQCHVKLAGIVLQIDMVNNSIGKMERHLEAMNGTQRRHAEWIAQRSVEADAHSEIVKRNYSELVDLRARVENQSQILTRASGTATGIHWAWIAILGLLNAAGLVTALMKR